MFEGKGCFVTDDCEGQLVAVSPSRYMCSHCLQIINPPISSWPCIMQDCRGTIELDYFRRGGCDTCGARQEEIKARLEELEEKGEEPWANLEDTRSRPILPAALTALSGGTLEM